MFRKARQAIQEVYSELIDEVILPNQYGKFKFYPDMTLEDVARKLSKTQKYRDYYYMGVDNVVDIEMVMDELDNLGYTETSVGVIYIYK